MPILWSVVLGIGCCGCLPVQVAFAEGFHGLQHRPKIDQAIQLLAAGHAERLEAASGYVYAVALSSAGQSDKALGVVDELLAADLYSAELMQLGISLAQQGQAPGRLGRYQDALRRL